MKGRCFVSPAASKEGLTQVGGLTLWRLSSVVVVVAIVVAVAAVAVGVVLAAVVADAHIVAAADVVVVEKRDVKKPFW